jgi:hypothetical protein
MATPQHAGYQQRGYLGRILVILGSLATLCDLAFLAQPLERMVERLREGLFALVPSLGLSFLSAARAIAFHQLDYFSLTSRILVLFTAMVAVIVGIVLLRPPSMRSTHQDHLRASASHERETDNG